MVKHRKKVLGKDEIILNLHKLHIHLIWETNAKSDYNQRQAKEKE